MSQVLIKIEALLIEQKIEGLQWRILRLKGEGVQEVTILEEVGIELRAQYAKTTNASRRVELVQAATIVAEELQKLRAERRARWAHYRKVDELNRTNGGWGASGRVGAPRWVDKDPDREWDRRFDED